MPRSVKLAAVRKACSLGNRTACQMSLRFAPSIFGASHISFDDVTFDDDNPNKMPYTGTLLIVDAPSTKPPHGSRGHRIMVPKAVAEKRLIGLIGMGLNYAPNLEEHAPRRKVGVITEAWIDGNKVRVKGFVYKKDFPEVEADFKQGRLGMSMELANVYVRDENSDVWYLEDFSFTGATVLKKEAAAYYQTALAAEAVGGKGEKGMKKPKTEQVAAQASQSQIDLLVNAVIQGVQKGMKPAIEGLKAAGDGISRLSDEFEEVKELLTISAAAKHDDDDDDDDDMEARREDDDDEMEAKSDDDDDDDEMEAAKKSDDSDDEDDSEDDDASDLEAEQEDLEKKAADPEPGDFNKDAKNKGRKTSVTKPPKQGDSEFENSVASKRLSSAGKPFPGIKSSTLHAAAFIGDLQAQVRQLRKSIKARDIRAAKQDKKLKKMHNRYSAMEAQVERFADAENRRSVLPTDLVNIAAKSNVDLREMQAAGQKMSVSQVDLILDNSGLQLDPTQRMTLKNKMLEQNLMDQGEVRRVQ